MKTKLTLLAVLASAAFMVQAQTPAAGNEPLNTAAPSTSSNTTRSAVEDKAAAAVKAGTIKDGDTTKAPDTSTNSTKSRSAVMEKGTKAQNAGTIKTGDGSANPANAGKMKSSKGAMQNDVAHSGDMKKSGAMAGSKSTDIENVKAGNAPYTKTPGTMSDKSRSEVTSGVQVDKIADGDNSKAPDTSATSTKSRAAVEAQGTAALKNDAIKTGDGAAAPKK